jgi:hypothetical protein
MKHRTKSASPCDLERQHFRDRLHRQAKSKQRGDPAGSPLSLSCPCCCTNSPSDLGACNDQPNRLRPKPSEHPACSLNGLWQRTNPNHGRSVVCSDHHTGAAFLTLPSHFCLSIRPASKPDDRTNSSIGELCTSVATAFPSPGGEGQGEGVLPQPLFTPDFPTRNEFLKLNLAGSGFKTWVTEVVQDMGNTCTVFLVRSGACHGRRLK